MKLHLPTYLGGDIVELEHDLKKDEFVIGWVDEYGTIHSPITNTRLGSLVQVKDREFAVIIIISPYKIVQ